MILGGDASLSISGAHLRLGGHLAYAVCGARTDGFTGRLLQFGFTPTPAASPKRSVTRSLWGRQCLRFPYSASSRGTERLPDSTCSAADSTLASQDGNTSTDRCHLRALASTLAHSTPGCIHPRSMTEIVDSAPLERVVKWPQPHIFEKFLLVPHPRLPNLTLHHC